MLSFYVSLFFVFFLLVSFSCAFQPLLKPIIPRSNGPPRTTTRIAISVPPSSLVPLSSSSFEHQEEDDDVEEVVQEEELSTHYYYLNVLDRAVLLYGRIQHTNHNTAVSLDWLQEQTTSLLLYIGNNKDKLNKLTEASSPNVPSLATSSSPEEIALAIERALLERSPSSEVDRLVQAYQLAKEASQRNSLLVHQDDDCDDPKEGERILSVIQQQLEAFETILNSLDDRKAPARQTPKELPVVAVAVDKPVVEDGRESSNGYSATTATTTTRNTSSSTTALRASQRGSSDDTVGDLEEQSQPNEYAAQEVLEDDSVDIAIVGAGLAGLCAGAILNTIYGKKVGIYESHYLAGGCAHAFDKKAPKNNGGMTFTFDSGPTILLGCSSKPYNAVRQVLEAVGEGDTVEWIPYHAWGMIENPGKANELRWRLELGPDLFENGPLKRFGGGKALEEFKALQQATKGLLAGVSIPAMALRPGSSALIPLLRYLPSLVTILSQGETTTGTFAPFMDGPLFTVTDPWLRNWLDALAFSLSGLCASRTAAAAMAFVLYDMHREGAALDYPKGGIGEIVNALVRAVETGNNGSKVHLRQHVERIDCSEDANTITGVTLRNGQTIKARHGVICNAPVWSLKNLIMDSRVLERLNNGNPTVLLRPDLQQPKSSWTTTSQGSSIKFDREEKNILQQSLLSSCDKAEQTGSFLHLHLAIDSRGLDLGRLEAHYTVMDRGLSGDAGISVNGVPDGPCGELNMIAVSNPCVLDKTLAPEGYIVLHAYGAGNEPYEIWAGLDRKSDEYKRLKQERAQVLWRAVEAVIPDARQRAVLELVGSPITHERFLRRPRGTYGSATEDYLRDGSTPYESLVLASDGIFPGIGLPAVCIAGASAANSFVNVFQHWQCLDKLKQQSKI